MTKEEYIEKLMYELQLYEKQHKEAEIQKHLNRSTITGKLDASI